MKEILAFIGIVFLFVILVILFIDGLNSDYLIIKIITLVSYLIISFICLIISFNIGG